MQHIISIQNLTKIFGESCGKCLEQTGAKHNTNICPICGSVVGCNNINLKLYPNEIIGIVGESGSGKSTLLKMLNFDIEHTTGAVTVNRSAFDSMLKSDDSEFYHMQQNLLKELDAINVLEISAYKKRMLRNLFMGIVYQNPHLGLRMNISAGGNIAEKLLMANWFHFGKIRERASSLVEKTEIKSERLDELPSNFSGGMQQRIQIAKALSNNPVILLLDEVTTGLDVSVQAKVLDLIKRIQNELKITTVVVSHDLGVIRLLSTRTLVMKYGQVVESGLTDQILENPCHPYTQLLVNSQL